MAYNPHSPHEILEELARTQKIGEDMLDELACNNYATIRSCWDPTRKRIFLDLFIETNRYWITINTTCTVPVEWFEGNRLLKEAILKQGKHFYPQLLKRSAGLALTLEALEEEKGIFIPRELINLFIGFSF